MKYVLTTNRIKPTSEERLAAATKRQAAVTGVDYNPGNEAWNIWEAKSKTDLIQVINKLTPEDVAKIASGSIQKASPYNKLDVAVGLASEARAKYSTIMTRFIDEVNKIKVEDFERGGSYWDLGERLDKFEKEFITVYTEVSDKGGWFKKGASGKFAMTIPESYVNKMKELLWLKSFNTTFEEIGYTTKESFLKATDVYYKLDKQLNDFISSLYKKLNVKHIGKVLEDVYVLRNLDDYDGDEEACREDAEYGVWHHGPFDEEYSGGWFEVIGHFLPEDDTSLFADIMLGGPAYRTIEELLKRIAKYTGLDAK